MTGGTMWWIGDMGIVRMWVGFWYVVMGYYSVLCGLLPHKALKSFTGDENYRPVYGELEMTKRLGIVYGIATIMGLYMTGTGSMDVLRVLCMMNCVYSLSLCILIKNGQLFWDRKGVMKNLPFVFINAMFTIGCYKNVIML